jgi:hypothetical protein
MPASEAWPKDVRCRGAYEEDSGRLEEDAVLGNVFCYVHVSGTHPTEDEDEFWVAALLLDCGSVIVVFG